MENSCAILSQNPMRFHWGFDEDDPNCHILKFQLLRQITLLHCSGISTFYVACDCGAGLYAAEIINLLRAQGLPIKLICIVPHENQATKWAPYLRDRYFSMIEQCDQMELLAYSGHANPQLAAYREIISRAAFVLAVFDTGSAPDSSIAFAVQFAQLSRKTILYIHPDTFALTGELFTL